MVIPITLAYRLSLMGYQQQKVYSIIANRFNLNTQKYFMGKWRRLLDDCEILLNPKYIDPQELLNILNSVNPAMIIITFSGYSCKQIRQNNLDEYLFQTNKFENVCSI